MYTRTTSGTIFSADAWISGGQVIFRIPLEAFASNKTIFKMKLNTKYMVYLTFNVAHNASLKQCLISLSRAMYENNILTGLFNTLRH